MSKLNERLTLVANLSVVVGIVFLATELRQNTEAIRSQTRDSITEKQMTYLGWRATSPELAMAIAQVDSAGLGSLTSWERELMGAYVGGIYREWENSFYQYERGLFTPDEFEARRVFWRRQLLDSPDSEAFRELWALGGDSFAPGFRAEINRILRETPS